MKIVARILMGIVGILVMIGGIHQMMEGLGYIKPTEKLGQRYSDAAHGCSYLVPEGWNKKDGKAGQLQFVGKGKRMLSVLTESYPGTLRQYVDANIAEMTKRFPSGALQSDTKFTTDKGTEGVTLVFTDKSEKEEFREIFNFYDGKPGQKIILAEAFPVADSDLAKPVLDSCAKSLELAHEAPSK